MAILPLTGVQIEIKIANERSAFVFIIPDTEDLNIWMPSNIILAVFCPMLEEKNVVE
jgi:hypothetical protein